MILPARWSVGFGEVAAANHATRATSAALTITTHFTRSALSILGRVQHRGRDPDEPRDEIDRGLNWEARERDRVTHESAAVLAGEEQSEAAQPDQRNDQRNSLEQRRATSLRLLANDEPGDRRRQR